MFDTSGAFAATPQCDTVPHECAAFGRAGPGMLLLLPPNSVRAGIHAVSDELIIVRRRNVKIQVLIASAAPPKCVALEFWCEIE